MPGLRFRVAPVEFRVGTVLLDDEHLDAQRRQCIESRRIGPAPRPGAAQPSRQFGGAGPALRRPPLQAGDLRAVIPYLCEQPGLVGGLVPTAGPSRMTWAPSRDTRGETALPTSIIAGTALGAERPSNPAIRSVGRGQNRCAELGTPSFFESRRMTWTRCPAMSQFPVIAHGGGANWRSVLTRSPKGLQQFADPGTSAVTVPVARRPHGQQVVRFDRRGQIGDLAGLEEFRRPSGERPEQQPVLAGDHPGVQIAAPTSGRAATAANRRPWRGGARSAPTCRCAATARSPGKPKPLTSARAAPSAAAAGPAAGTVNTNLLRRRRFSPVRRLRVLTVQLPSDSWSRSRTS